MNSFARTIFIFSLMAFALFANAEDQYKMIDPAQPTQVADGKVEVVEIFWYGCPHCYEFEPYLEDWLENKKPENVEFRRMPGIFSDEWIPLGRAYYAAEELGVVEKTHQALFNAIHKEKRHLNDQKSLAKFYAEHGVDEDKFNDAYESDAVNDKVKKAFVAGRRYQVRGVPSIVIEGKYLTGSSIAGSFENMLKVTDQLVDKESK